MKVREIIKEAVKKPNATTRHLRDYPVSDKDVAKPVKKPEKKKPEQGVAEEKQKGVDGKACWDGYKRMGTKKKGGKTVDNCVKVGESATAGATSTANIGTVVNPHISPGKARGKKSYLGSPSTGSGTKSPPQPKIIQPKNSDGTAKGAHAVKGVSLFGGPTIKRR